MVAQRAATGAARPDSLYNIRDDILIRTPDGATLSAMVVRRKDATGPRPTLLTFDIYTDTARFRARGKEEADHGYVGVTVDTRGKRLSRDAILPYEYEVGDTYAAIDWIARQPWSDGQVGMLGGSYSGFSAWAATKRLHPALKTIAVSAAVIPGLGLPMWNNVFLNANYAWAFYVGDTRYLDDTIYADNARWSRMTRDWFTSGRPYRAIDSLDGKPNPWLHRWLAHPAYDAYWQHMVPYKGDFSGVTIPVLTITGYYDDAQISALEYVKEHNEYNPHADHYVVIGPYDHIGTHAATKDTVLRDYPIDSVAQFSTPDLKYAWMDYVMRNGPRPAILVDKINYEVMGGNVWRHAATLDQMSRHPAPYDLSTALRDGRRRLELTRPSTPEVIDQSVDLRDRTVEGNAHAYPYPIIQRTLDNVTELVFVTDPVDRDTTVSGAFRGDLDVAISTRDADLGVTVFEQLPDGRLFNLAYWLGRASFARDNTVRHLLTPGQPTHIPFETSVMSRRLIKGSRLMVLLDVNKTPIAQVNYGTGKSVSDESIADAKGPVRLRWYTDSYITAPFE
jgi:putative CocE/NonD family hydrolase